MAVTRKCANCGKTFTPEKEWHKYCSSRCQHEADSSQPRVAPDTRTAFRFDNEYLKGGYFKDKEQKELDPGVVDELAYEVAKALTNTGVNSHQLRRFYGRARAIEQGIGTARPFPTVKADLAELKSVAAYQVGRGVVRDEFKQFIDRNIELALQSEANFVRGFIPHFAAIIGFFTYLKPEKEERRNDRRN